MNYLSICSGIEAASVAWHHLGWTPVGFAEIEPFPSAVLRHHYPGVKNYGDISHFRDWPVRAGDIDLLVGGTPCQSFSIAGLRQGLKDPRGNLMLTFLAIAEHLKPKWIVWENVCGVLSSNGGKDFGCFLGGVGELGYGFAYRVLDAQWIRTQRHPRAVPQRRRRVFVVGCFGDATSAAKVLFESESLQRYSAPRTTARKRIASDVAGGSGVPFTKSKRAQSTTDDETWIDGAVAPTMSPFDQGDIRATTTIAIQGTVIGRQDQNGLAGSGHSDNGEMFILNTTDRHAVAFRTDCYNGAITGDVAATMGTPGSSVNASGPTVAVAPTITATNDPSRSPQSSEITQQVSAVPFHNTAATLKGGSAGSGYRDPSDGNGHSIIGMAAHSATMQVRRLTPLECERLQGFPDGWTAIPWKNKGAADCPDGPRYKALGNSMAVNCMEWIGERIDSVERSVRFAPVLAFQLRRELQDQE